MFYINYFYVRFSYHVEFEWIYVCWCYNINIMFYINYFYVRFYIISSLIKYLRKYLISL